jgi:hypothetical protein
MPTPNPALDRLGFDASARLVIFHVDDVGMCHGSNRAYLDLHEAGIVKTGSLMAPCPWAQEMIALCQQRPDLDLGVHLTLNSEWPQYRWGPLTTRDQASGLIDPTGCFWPVPEITAMSLNVPYALAELRAQIDLVHDAGIQFTHIDSHMGAALHPELYPHYIEFGFEYRVPILVLRGFDDYTRGFNSSGMDDAAWGKFIAELEERGMPLVDTFRITPGYHADDAEGGRAELYERILRDLPPGITYFSLHANAPGDIEAIDGRSAFWRTFEYQYFQSDRLRRFLEREEIIPIGYEELRELMRSVV